MGSKSRILLCLSFGLCLLIACSKDPLIPFEIGEKELKPVLPEVPFVYGTDTFPSTFNSPPLSFINSIQNAITSHGATLGRVLFYDKKAQIKNKSK